MNIFWVLFSIIIAAAIFHDLWIQGHRKKGPSMWGAGFWTLMWISLALLFDLVIYVFLGPQKALEFLTAYLLEKSLSLDNLFVFLVIFSYFDIPPLFQERVLKWGILGAILMRAAFILGGIWLLENFHFLFFVFGAFLIFSGIKLMFQKEEKISPEKNLFLRIIRKILPLAENSGECRFFVRNGKAICMTTLFVALILIETSDLIFAIDSVPAVLAITSDPFIAYTSNVFAILGLRTLYFFLVGFLPKFVYLKKGVITLLIVIGFKMILGEFIDIPVVLSLAAVLLILISSIILSILKQDKTNANTH